MNYLIKINNFISEDIPFYFNRIRANGNISKDINNNQLKKSIKIFGIYFICYIDNYLKIISDQLNILNDSELYNNTKKIYCFLYLSDPNVLELLSKFPKIIIINSNEKSIINNFLPENENYYLYFFHSKKIDKNNDLIPLCNHFTLKK